ncbi:SnoaL-like protein [Rhodovulum bhavnagarense]|uniref:SnoaL-like protein n=1 Tax=Rhodovulum bhavnagarense TaxID=992286 RepID=A0A4V2SW13_9RHOB|nr:nuclear transport factor 2 family protein [Rhodovulum bhavnagarense]TCP60586.1 SnoaL-like protein [Rhodovulum bhavnagarense]
MGRVSQLEEWYRRVYLLGELDAVETLFTADTRAEGMLADSCVGPEDIRVFAMALMHMVEAPRFRIVNAVEAGDWLAALIETEAIRADTGRPIRVFGQLMARFQGDRIAEAYNNFDFFSFFEQMDILPPNSLALGMGGQRIA